MFKGTDEVASGDFSAIVEAQGGNDNAFTNNDYTAYFQRVAADRLDLMMKMESDRMRDLRLTEEDVLTERDVILEERGQRTDSDPGALLSEQMSAAQFLNHSYGVPIIGWRHEMEALDLETALAGADWVVLPGSKQVSGDLAWLRAQGLDRAIADPAGQGGAVLGICGGLQMLGEALIDTHGVDGNAPGLGLLPLVTQFDPDKTVQRTQACFGDLVGAWSALSGVTVQGYEIHHGQTAQHPAMAAAGDIAREVLPGLAWQNDRGNVLGCYLHGLFEDPAVLQALFGASAPTLDSVFDGLADYLERHIAPGVLDALIA